MSNSFFMFRMWLKNRVSARARRKRGDGLAPGRARKAHPPREARLFDADRIFTMLKAIALTRVNATARDSTASLSASLLQWPTGNELEFKPQTIEKKKNSQTSDILHPSLPRLFFPLWFSIYRFLEIPYRSSTSAVMPGQFDWILENGEKIPAKLACALKRRCAIEIQTTSRFKWFWKGAK